ncbi:MAG TPA: SUMF1/EgtB/PvdO family nonheme iron enzyme [Xanthomonadaceae bacterium]|nr:SUMF1/EgtB/PvdO family nonheme iron enzyme [Xanthomonadaceae bacterium]
MKNIDSMRLLIVCVALAVAGFALGDARAATPSGHWGTVGLLGALTLHQAEEEEESERREYQIRRRLVDSTAREDEWMPDLTAPPTISTADLLADADAAARAGRLFEPEGDNALSLYLQILERDPGNAEARAGIDRVVEQLIAQANSALVANRVNEATRMLGVAERIRPEAASVQQLRRTMEAGREVAAWLAQAADARRAGQLVAPEGSSAADLYRRVLERDSGNEQAQQGMAAIETALLEQAATAASEKRFGDAERLLADAGRVRPGSQALLDTASRIQSARQAHAVDLMAQAEAALDEQNFQVAEQLANEAESLSPDIEGFDDFRDRIVSVRVYASMRPGQVFSDTLAGGLGNGPEMVVIPMGSFRMGSPDRERDRRANEGPQFEVRFAKAFAMARTEVTVAQFRQFVQATGYQTDAERQGNSTTYSEETGRMDSTRRISWQNDYAGARAENDHPVVHVSWNDANAYAQWLAQVSGHRYRLPSEAEFEFSLRAGSTTRYWWGDDNPDRVVENVTGDGERSPSRRSWSNAFPSYDDGYWGTAPVRSYPPNPFGLHDMNGNVTEWVEDCWHDTFVRAPADGRAWVNPGCDRRVLRGASWASAPDQARSAFRINAPADTRGARVGFRVAREL